VTIRNDTVPGDGRDVRVRCRIDGGPTTPVADLAPGHSVTVTLRPDHELLVLRAPRS
jgi:hypothetical protein